MREKRRTTIMEKILVLIGSPQFADKSFSTQATHYFMDTYKAAHSDVEFDIVRVADLPEIRFTPTILAGEPTESDMQILANRTALLEKYKAADKIILATPMWDFGLPGTVKEVLDAFCVAGETFKYLDAPDAEGNISTSLMPAKKILFIQAMGGQHKGTAGDLGYAQVKALLSFIGNRELEYVAVENVAIPNVDALANAKIELDEVVRRF